MRVFCRVRPPLEGEEEAEVAVQALDETTILLEDPSDAKRPRRRFEFNQVYGPKAENAKVFEDVRPMISQTLQARRGDGRGWRDGMSPHCRRPMPPAAACSCAVRGPHRAARPHHRRQGFNVCAIMYGGAGSGKSHTLEGSAAEPGLLSRCVAAIFEEITGVDESMSYEVFLSTLEIVDEVPHTRARAAASRAATFQAVAAPPAPNASPAPHRARVHTSLPPSRSTNVPQICAQAIRDLQLADGAAQPAFRVRRDATYGMQVDGLTSAPVHTASHVRSLLAAAQGARQKDVTCNLVVTLMVRSANTESGESSVGKLTLVDLASAETAHKADDAPHNASLAALHSVVDALASSKSSKKAPFGSSLLTELLQDSLGGNCKTMMFVTVSPTQAKATLSGEALAFGVKARSISLGPASRNKESMKTAMHKVNTTMTALSEHAGGRKK